MVTNIFLVDDHELMREGLKTVLDHNQQVSVVGEAGSFTELIRKLDGEVVDLLILDINLPDRGGLDVLKYLRSHYPEIRVLVLSMHPEERFALRALKAGAVGYVDKQTAAKELMNAIDRVMNGGKYISTSLTDQLVHEVGNSEKRLPHQDLSDREFEVLRMIAMGRSTSDIGNDLSLSVNTVTTYRSRILEKMNLKTNADIVRYALEHSLID